MGYRSFEEIASEHLKFVSSEGSAIILVM